MTAHRRLMVAIALALVAALGACGDDGDGGSPTTAPPSEDPGSDGGAEGGGDPCPWYGADEAEAVTGVPMVKSPASQAVPPDYLCIYQPESGGTEEVKITLYGGDRAQGLLDEAAAEPTAQEVDGFSGEAVSNVYGLWLQLDDRVLQVSVETSVPGEGAAHEADVARVVLDRLG